MLLKVDNLSYFYGKKCAIEETSFSFETPQMLGILGPNGGGKSTLLKILSGLYAPTSGTVFKGFETHKIAYISQQSTFDHYFPIRVKDVVAMGLYKKVGPLHSFSKNDKVDIQEAIYEVGLEEFENAPINTLSGGQFQRMMFARLIVQRAELLLLDEPFAAIDFETTLKLLTLLKAWHKAGKTICVVIHDLKIASHHFEKLMIFSKKVIQIGTPREVFNTPFFEEPFLPQVKGMAL